MKGGSRGIFIWVGGRSAMSVYEFIKIALMNALKHGKGFALWSTGLSGAGKSTNAYNVYEDKV
jgi:adenylylsulfate kinase-like enzyme